MRNHAADRGGFCRGLGRHVEGIFLGCLIFRRRFDDGRGNAGLAQIRFAERRATGCVGVQRAQTEIGLAFKTLITRTCDECRGDEPLGAGEFLGLFQCAPGDRGHPQGFDVTIFRGAPVECQIFGPVWGDGFQCAADRSSGIGTNGNRQGGVKI